MQPRVSVADLVAKKLEPTPDMVSQQLQDVRSQQQIQRLISMESSFVAAIGQLIKYLDGKTTKTEVVNHLKTIGTPDVLEVVKAIQQLDKNVLANKFDIAPLKDGLAALEAQLKLIPKVLPTAQKSLEVSNLSDIGKEFDRAIQNLKLDAPKVNVNVKEPNLVPLQVIFRDLLLAVRNIKLPEAKETDVTGVEKRLDDVVSVTSAQEKYHKEANKLLKDIANRPMGGGSGGGTSGVYSDAAGNIVYPQLTVDGKVPVSATFSGSISASTEYTDGAAVVTHPVGGIPVFNKAGTITAVSDTNPLPVSASVTATVASANNSYGTTTSLADAATAALVSIASSTAGYKVTGLLGTGTGDGYFFVQVAGSTIFSGRTSVSQQSLEINLPNPVAISTASAVTLKVTNKSGSTADFEGTLLGV